MKPILKACIISLFCFYSMFAHATKKDSLILAENLIVQTQYDDFSTEYVFGMFENSFSNPKDFNEYKAKFKEIHGDEIKRIIAKKLVANYSDDELREIQSIFKSDAVKRAFAAYYKTWLKSGHGNDLFKHNLNLFLATNKLPRNIEKHRHYGKTPDNDAILNMMKLMDELKGDNAVAAYRPWAKTLKEKELKRVVIAHPELVGYEKELSKIYDYSKDTFSNYWGLRESKHATMRDFQVTADAMMANEAFRQFFTEIYTINLELGKRMEKRELLEDWGNNQEAMSRNPTITA